MTLDIINSI